MVVSLVYLHACRFAREEIWRNTRDAKVKIKRVKNETPYQHCVHTVQVIHECFSQIFPCTKFTVDFKTVMRKLPDLCKKSSDWNPMKKTVSKQYFEAFSAYYWKVLSHILYQSTAEAAEHSLSRTKARFPLGEFVRATRSENKNSAT